MPPGRWRCQSFSSGWSREFDESIELPDGNKLVTLRDAANYITALPAKEAALPECQGRDRGPDAGGRVARHGATRMWEKDKVWDADPVLLPFRDIPPFGRLAGYAGPPNRKAAEVVPVVIQIRKY
jgi:hypothetical protein